MGSESAEMTYDLPIVLPPKARQRHNLSVYIGGSDSISAQAFLLVHGKRRPLWENRDLFKDLQLLDPTAMLIAVFGGFGGELNPVHAQPLGSIPWDALTTQQVGFGPAQYLGAPMATPPPWGSPGYIPISSSLLEARAYTAYLPTAHLPRHFDALCCLDAIVLIDVSHRDLDTRQIEALRKFVAAGGTLVVTGGADWRRLWYLWQLGLVPAEPAGVVTVPSLSGLGKAFAIPMTRTASTILTRVILPTDADRKGLRVLLREGQYPLAVSKQHGLGQFIFITCDINQEPFRSWAGQRLFWGHILLSAWSPWLEQAYPEVTDKAAGSALAKIPALAAPSLHYLLLLLIAYLVILVPANYWVLKLLDKREWAWFTVPFITLLFTVAMYWMGYWLKGRQLLMPYVFIVHTRSGQSWARVQGQAGIFSPAHTYYTVQPMRSSSLMCPQSERLSAPPVRLRLIRNSEVGWCIDKLRVPMWSMKSIEVRSAVRLNGSINGVVTLKDSEILVRVRNNSSLKLQQVYLVWGGVAFAVAEEMQPGKEQRTTWDANVLSDFGEAGKLVQLLGIQPVRTPHSTQRAPKAVVQSFISALLQRYPTEHSIGLFPMRRPILTAWCAELPWCPFVLLQEHPTMLGGAWVIVELPTPRVEGKFKLKPVMVPLIVLAHPGRPKGTGAMAPGGIELNKGHIVLKAQLPRGKLQLSSLEIAIGVRRGFVAIDAVDFVRGQLRPVGTTKVNRRIALSPPRRFVNASNEVVFRIYRIGSTPAIVTNVGISATGRAQ